MTDYQIEDLNDQDRRFMAQYAVGVPFGLPDTALLAHIAVSLKRIADTLESGHVYVRSGDAS